MGSRGHSALYAEARQNRRTQRLPAVGDTKHACWSQDAPVRGNELAKGFRASRLLPVLHCCIHGTDHNLDHLDHLDNLDPTVRICGYALLGRVC